MRRHLVFKVNHGTHRPVGTTEALAIHREWLKGGRLEDIAKKFNRPLPTISLVANTVQRTGTYSSPRRDKMLARIRYPGLRDWMRKTGATIAEMARVCDISGATMRGWVFEYSPKTGNSEYDQINKKTIDALIAWTGMTYEQIFYSPERLRAVQEDE